jgi:hypothetical protein
MWARGHNSQIRRATYGYEPTREAAMAAFAKSWRRGRGDQNQDESQASPRALHAPIVRRTVVVVQLPLPRAVAPVPVSVACEGRRAA